MPLSKLLDRQALSPRKWGARLALRCSCGRPDAGSEVEALRPLCAQLNKSARSYTTRPPSFRYVGPVP